MGEVREWLMKVHDNGVHIQVWRGPGIDGPTEVISKADLQPYVDEMKEELCVSENCVHFTCESIRKFLKAWEGSK